MRHAMATQSGAGPCFRRKWWEIPNGPVVAKRPEMRIPMLFAVASAAAFSSAVVACGGTDSGIIPSDGGANNPPSDQLPDGGTVIDNGGTTAFSTAKAYISRDGAWCGSPPPFLANDSFSLVLIGPGTQDPFPEIDIGVGATSPVHAPQALTVAPWKPGPAPTAGENDINQEGAYSESTQLGFSLARGMTTNLPDPTAYDQATLTVLSIPQKEGDTLQVRVQLHFTDGATLDQTFVSPVLAEVDTPCAGAD
jgi:hypothetical protein